MTERKQREVIPLVLLRYNPAPDGQQRLRRALTVVLVAAARTEQRAAPSSDSGEENADDKR